MNKFSAHGNIFCNSSVLLNPYKPSVLFVGHRQTVQNQMRRRKMRCLIRFLSTICLQNKYKNLNKKEKYHPTTLKLDMDSSN